MLGGLFGQRTFLDRDDEAWQIDTWRWLLTHNGGLKNLKDSPLVTPTRTFFPPSETTGPARAEHIFEIVKTLAGMADWPCLCNRNGSNPSSANLRS